MKKRRGRSSARPARDKQHVQRRRSGRGHHNALPAAAYRQRGGRNSRQSEPFNAPEIWHEPTGGGGGIRYAVQPPGAGYLHPVSVEDIRRRIEALPRRFTRSIEVVQLSRMTRKRAYFPCYGMQWGPNIYLYPIEESFVESYVRPPRPEQLIEARMFGGCWAQEGETWTLTWTPETIRDFYLNNVLVHEIGHVNDDRNNSFADRERYANWFAVEYGYRASRGRRKGG